MTEASSTFATLSILVLVVVLLVFAMKYAAAGYKARLDARRQTQSDEALAALRQDVGALTTRLNTVEKLLREVE